MNQQEKLEHIAEGVRSDIEGDHAGVGDTDYDLYIEDLTAMGTKWTVGVIDMGEMYQGVYVWHEFEKKWDEDPSWGNTPQDVIDRITKKRRSS
jgi:hypothetical protein